MKKAVPFIIFGIVAVLLITACGALGVGLANRTFVAEAVPENAGTQFVGVVDSMDEKNQEYFNEIHAMKDLHDLVSSWATTNNEARMHLNTVTTYLLVVKEPGTVTTNYGNADIIALVSVNTDAKKVSVIALDNDCLVYVDLSNTTLTADGPIYAKLNTAYANGGITLLEKTIEQNFKIEIDHYLVTDMEGLEDVANALDGVSVMLDEKLKDMITDDFNVIMPADNTPLNGQQTVAYLREKRDGARSRATRHADALAAAIKSAQAMSITEALDLVKILASVTVTDLAGTDLVGALRATVLGNWNDYNVVSYTSPKEENAVNYKDSDWIRVIDIPVEAQSIQDKLFNKTNITLNDSRLSAVELINAVNKLYQEGLELPNSEDVTAENDPAAENGEEAADDNSESDTLG